MNVPHVCILGDFDPSMPTHQALDQARAHTLSRVKDAVTFEWVATGALVLDDLGTRFQGLWVAPGSPYRDEPRVLAALERARTLDLPTLGNCGGFQFMVLEFARNVAGIAGARHAESPEAGGGPAVIVPLACSLRGVTETVDVAPSSLLASLVGPGLHEGRYFCSYGVDPTYSPVLEAAGLRWTSRSPDGQPRSCELVDRRFFVGCLFQPALDSTPERPHPVIVGFLRAVAGASLVYRTFSEVTPEFVELTRDLDRELRARNGDAQDTYDGFNALTGIGDVVLAYDGTRPVGCASFKRRESTAEVKRVYVDPDYRGRGVSKALMARLEDRARSSGIRTLLVETSRTFPEANGLYPGLGFRVTDNFPPYEGLELSVCYRKDLA